MFYRVQPFIFTILLALVSSCGESGKTTASLERLSLSLHGANLDAMLYGRHKNGLIFSVYIDDGTETLDLPNGDWKFSLVSWERLPPPSWNYNPLAGKVRCGETDQRLTGGDAEISIDLNSDNCKNPTFSHPSYLTNTNEFKPVEFHFCQNLNGIVSNSTCYGGKIQFYKVSPISNVLGLSSIDFNRTNLQSDCLVKGGTNIGLKLPINSGSAMAYKIEGFDITDPNCFGTPVKTFNFAKGIEPLSEVLIFSISNPTENKTRIFLQDAPSI